MAGGINLGTAWLNVVPSFKGMGDATRKALGDVDAKVDSEAKGWGKTASSAFGSTFKIAGAAAVAGLVAVTAAVGSYIGDAIAASDATDKFKSTLAFGGIDSSKIDELTASTKKYADQTVYELADIQNVTAQLAANSVKDYDKLAEAAGNLNAVAGGNVDTYKSVGMVLTQTAGQGKLTTENWNQLADAIPGASGKIQEALKKNTAFTGDFREAMSKGEITAEEFNQAILDLGMADVAKEAATSTKTIEGAWGNLEASITSGLMEVIDQVKPALTSAMSAIADGASNAFSWVSGTLLPGLKAVWDLLAHGDYTGSLFGLEEDSPAVGALLAIRDTAISVWDLLAHGDYTGSLFGLEEDSPAVGALLTIRDTAISLGKGLAALASRKDVLITIATGLGTWKTAMVAVSTWQTIMATKTKILTIATGVWNSVMAANPLTLVVLALAALVGGLVYAYQHSERFRAVVQGAWEAIKVAAAAAVEWFTTTALPVLQTVWDGIKAGAEVVTVWFTTTLLPALQGVWQAVSEYALAAWEWIKWAWDTIGYPVASFILTVFQGVAASWGPIWEGIKTTVSGAWQVISTVVSTALQVIKGLFSLGAAILRGDWSAAWEAIKGIVSAVWEGIKGVVSGALDILKGVVSTALSVVKGVWSGAWTAISSAVSSAWAGIKSVVSRGVTTMMSTIQTIPSRVRSAFAGAGTWLLDAGRTIISGLVDGIKSKFAAVKSSLTGLTSLLPSWKGPAERDAVLLRPAGELIISGLRESMESEYASVRASLISFTKSLQPDVKTSYGFAASGAVVPASQSLDGTSLVLRVGDREMTAWVEERVDGRIILADQVRA